MEKTLKKLKINISNNNSLQNISFQKTIFEELLNSYYKIKKINKSSNLIGLSINNNFIQFKSILSKAQNEKIWSFLNKNLNFSETTNNTIRIYYNPEIYIELKSKLINKTTLILNLSTKYKIKLLKNIKNNFTKKFKFINSKNSKHNLFLKNKIILAINMLSNQIQNFTLKPLQKTEIQNNADIVIHHLYAFIKYINTEEIIRNHLPKSNRIIRTKAIIENICSCLNTIAEMKLISFEFKNLDAQIKCNNLLFMNLILNLCYQTINASKENQKINIVSYVENNKFFIELSTICIPNYSFTECMSNCNTYLHKTKSRFKYQSNSLGETIFSLSMPCESIHS